LFGRFLAPQVPLSGFAEFDLSRTSYLESFGYTFVSLLHFMEKNNNLNFLLNYKQAKYASVFVYQQAKVALVRKPYGQCKK
tara:strand:+ start:216 stop:458 length:243 start_codon:yes stop_codon:yes gene_type:complete